MLYLDHSSFDDVFYDDDDVVDFGDGNDDDDGDGDDDGFDYYDDVDEHGDVFSFSAMAQRIPNIAYTSWEW